jgi:hypothetical protein
MDGVESAYQAALTPEQIAAINAGGGFATCKDPTNHVQYHLIQVEPSSIDDDYIREMIVLHGARKTKDLL